MTRLTGVTIAATNLEAMAEFYQRVFGATLSKRAVGGFTLYFGELAGFHLQLCPKDVAGIDAAQNRHQLTFTVDDVAATVALAEQHRGSSIDEFAIRDPDGNSIELARTK